MKKIILITLLSVMILSVDLAAASELDHRPGKCTMKETVSVTINFKGSVQKATKVKELVDQQEQEIMDIAKTFGIKDIKISSQNFNINSNYNYGSSYQYSGNIGLKLSPYDKALLLLDELKAKNYQVSLNVSRYAQGNC